MIAMHMTVYLSAAAKKTSLKSGLAPQSELNATTNMQQIQQTNIQYENTTNSTNWQLNKNPQIKAVHSF